MQQANKFALIVALYLAKFDTAGLGNLGYKNWTAAFNDISAKLKIKSSLIKNMRDQFDAVTDNNRAGWHQRPLVLSRRKVLEAFGSMPEPAFREVVQGILHSPGYRLASSIEALLVEEGSTAEGHSAAPQPKYFVFVCKPSNWSLCKTYGMQGAPKRDRALAETAKTGDRVAFYNTGIGFVGLGTVHETQVLSPDMDLRAPWNDDRDYPVRIHFNLDKEFTAPKQYKFKGNFNERIQLSQVQLYASIVEINEDQYQAIEADLVELNLPLPPLSHQEIAVAQLEPTKPLRHKSETDTRPPRRYWRCLLPVDVPETALGKQPLPLAHLSDHSSSVNEGDVVFVLNQLGAHAIGTVTSDAITEQVYLRWWKLHIPRKPVPMPDWEHSDVSWLEVAPETAQEAIKRIVAAVSYLAPEYIDRLLSLVLWRKQIILDGPPGTGKTWLARLMASIITISDPLEDDLIRFVQFHPNYGYEDFVLGLRPNTGSNNNEGGQFRWVPGHFLQLSEVAKGTPGMCVIVIDEINRGNLPRIFGELLFALEYRDQKIPLAYGQEPFVCPPNLIIIGTMNTADRSIALVDHALRRRFAFWRCNPAYDVLSRWLDANPPADVDANMIVSGLKWLNDRIRERYQAGLLVGHSYFMKRSDSSNGFAGPTKQVVRMTLETEIIPLLEEYGLDTGAATEELTAEALVVQFGVADEVAKN